MIDITLNLLAESEVDGRQLRQRLEALEVSCSRGARVRKRQREELSVGNLPCYPAEVTPTDFAPTILHSLSTRVAIDVTFHLLAAFEADRCQLRAVLEAVEVACSRRA